MSHRDRKVGHVYIMFNPAMPGMVKIGRTRDQTKARARQLYSTGVPKEFVVLWQELVHDSDEVERKLHEQFKASRANPRREFFEIEPQEAIRSLMEVARSYNFTLSQQSARVNVLDELKAKFGSDLRPDLVAVSVAQDEFREKFLEIVRVPADRKDKKEFIDYVDLSVTFDEFTLRQPLEDIAEKFLGLDILSVAMVTDLLKDEVGQRVWEEHERQKETLQKRE